MFNIILLLLLAGLVIYFVPSVIRYFLRDPKKNILITLIWFVNSILALFCASFFRNLYLLDEEVESFFRAGGPWDRSFIWFSFGLAIIFILLLFSFYQKNFYERFLLITAVQVALISGGYLLDFLVLQETYSENILLPVLFLLVAVIMFIFSRKKSEETLKELLVAFFERLFAV